MRYGFVIDQRKCIGCHACTVACKAENEVPLGNFRTWVKYVEEGTFPDTERHFAVLRCNHCDNAPCVKICPVTALFTRADGIVDFDQNQCIGCKACMQACPYDALYINPTSKTAEKCNFCAHRVEVGLQPACVIVCPEQAIITGDLDNPTSNISQLIKEERGVARKPEQGTKPKLYYIGSNKSVLKPELQRRESSYMWAETGINKMTAGNIDLQQYIAQAKERTARTAYDVPHEQPWGWRVSAYLWTKSIAAGSFFLPVLWLFNKQLPRAIMLGSMISLLFQGLTAILLVVDLKRPERFLRILLRPQWKSWLAIGAYILTAFGGISTLCLLAEFLGSVQIANILAIPGALLAVFAAIYSGYLFKQAEGRDFWQSRFTTYHLFIQAYIAGAAIFGLVSVVMPQFANAPRSMLALGLLSHLVIIALEIISTRRNRAVPGEGDAARAMDLLVKGPFKGWFWGGAVAFGAIIPALLLALNLPIAIAALPALIGLLIYESLWIKVGQAIPLS